MNGVCEHCGSQMSNEEIIGAEATSGRHGGSFYWCNDCFKSWGDMIFGWRDGVLNKKPREESARIWKERASKK